MSRKMALIVGRAVALEVILSTPANAQPALKKIRMGISSTNVLFRAMFTCSTAFFSNEARILSPSVGGG